MSRSRVVDIEGVRRELRARVAEAGSAAELARRWGCSRTHVSEAACSGKRIPLGIVMHLGYVREVRYRAVAERPDADQT